MPFMNVTSTANIAVGYISNIYTSNITGVLLSQWTGTTGSPIYYAPYVGIGSTVTPTANLQVAGNVYVSNALSTTNVFVSGNVSVSGNVNTTQFLINGVPGTTGQVITATGTGSGIQWASGGGGSSQWSGISGNPIYYVPQVGVGSTATPTSNLQVTGNVYASNAIITANVFTTGTVDMSQLTIGGSAGTPGQVLTATGTGSSIVWASGGGGGGSSQWSGVSGFPIYYVPQVGIGSATTATSNLQVTGNLYVSNAITTTNITATGIITGTWNGVNQGSLFTLGTNLGTTSFASSSDTPTLQAIHLNLNSFTQNSSGIVSSYTITAQGLIKFSATGLYQLTTVIAADSPVRKVALGTNTSSAFPSSTSAYTYVLDVPAAQSPSAQLTVPINVTDISKWYYIDIFTQSTSTSGTLYVTSSTSVAGSRYGTWIQLAPFGTYISSAVNAAAGILVTTSGTTLSSPLAQASPLASPSNTYHVTMTSGAGWTQTGSSGTLAVSPNGNLQFYQAGVFSVTVCFYASAPRTFLQVGIGSSSSDASLPLTIGPYTYKYAPMYTTDPSTTIVMPLNVTDVTKYYYIDVTFDTSSTVTLLSTSTFVSVTPLSSYIPNPMSTSSIVVSQVVTAQATSYTATSADSYIGMSNGGTVTLPQGATLTRGKMYTIKDESGKAGTNATYNVTIQLSGVDVIDGQTSVSIQLAYTSVNLMWTGANNRWVFI